MSNKTALFIGRFQPFHKGHLSVIQDIYPKYERIIIGIGSAEDNYSPDNPFTAGERYEMIRKSLEAEGFDMAKIDIIPVRNVDDYALWVGHVEVILPKFDLVYTGSPIVRELFEKDGRYEIKAVDKKLEINATMIREKILQSEKWEDLVPEAVADYLKGIEGEMRIRKIAR